MFRGEVITSILEMSRASGPTAVESLRNSALDEWWRLGVKKVIVRD
jgi:hypothetical protein